MAETTDTLPKRVATKKATAKSASSTELIFGSQVMTHGYTALPNVFVRSQKRLGISTTQFNIIVQLLSYWIDPKRPPFPSKRELASRIGITEQTLRINIKALEEQGLVERVPRVTSAGDYGSNTYKLDGLVKKLKKLAPDFDAERKERQEAKARTETPNARSSARRSAMR